MDLSNLTKRELIKELEKIEGVQVYWSHKESVGPDGWVNRDFVVMVQIEVGK